MKKKPSMKTWNEKKKNQASIKTQKKHEKNNDDQGYKKPWYGKKKIKKVVVGATLTEQGWKKWKRYYSCKTNRKLQYNFWLHLQVWNQHKNPKKPIYCS
jgi:hypothetical protein